MLSHPSAMTVSSRALNLLADTLRRHRNQRATRWRKLSAGRQALLVVSYLRKGETYTELACGFQVGTRRCTGTSAKQSGCSRRWPRPSCRSSPIRPDRWRGSRPRCPVRGTIWVPHASTGVIDTLAEAGIDAVADTAYPGAGPNVAVPQRRRRLDPDTGRYRPLSEAQKQVNAAHARQRGPGERVNAELKNWQILRKIRSCPTTASELVAAVQTLMITSA